MRTVRIAHAGLRRDELSTLYRLFNGHSFKNSRKEDSDGRLEVVDRLYSIYVAPLPVIAML